MPSKVYLPIHRLMSIIRTVSPREVCYPKYITPSIQPQAYRPKYIALKYTVTLFTVPHFSMWSFDASETGESTKYPWVGVVEDTHLHLDAINPIASTHGHLYSAQFCSHPETLMAACLNTLPDNLVPRVSQSRTPEFMCFSLLSARNIPYHIPVSFG